MPRPKLQLEEVSESDENKDEEEIGGLGFDGHDCGSLTDK